MSDRIQDGRWFQVDTPEQHQCLKRYGRTPEPPVSLFRSAARVQIGTWVGPGRYMVLQYTQRCPRNCCDDDVCKVLSAVDVAEQAREEMRELAAVLKAAAGGPI